MLLKKLSLVNFKNYSHFSSDFYNGINCILGANGVGKTNILDAIHYLSISKGFVNSFDISNIKYNNSFFIVQGIFEVENKEHKIYCAVKKNTKKLFKHNGKEYEKISEHIGKFPVVVISPLDHQLVTDNGEQRRKWLNAIISQFDKNYLYSLIKYKKVLQQRNKLLKQFAEQNNFDKQTLEIWDKQIIEAGEIIFNIRKQFLKEINNYLLDLYKKISNENESISLHYESSLNEKAFKDILKENLERDKTLQYTTKGIHRDDIIFKINELPVRRSASQGQQKTLLLALKFSQYYILKNKLKHSPILLLDDIFDKLDEKRLLNVLNLMKSDDFAQIFITDTSFTRIPELLRKYKIKYHTIPLHNKEYA